MVRLYLIIGVVVAALITGGLMYRACKKEWQVEQELKAHKEVQRETQEVQREQEKRREKVEKLTPRELLDWFHGVRP